MMLQRNPNDPNGMMLARVASRLGAAFAASLPLSAQPSARIDCLTFRRKFSRWLVLPADKNLRYR